MDEREELKLELERELQLIKYRMSMLDIIEAKLLQVKKIAERIKEENITENEMKVLNINVQNLVEQIKAIDGESRRTEDGKILE